ncbi:MATE family efflux transporter [Nonomuraea thailandensis]
MTVLVGRRDGHAPLGPVIRAGWVLWAVISVAVAVPGVLLREPLAALFTDSPALTAGFFLISLGGLPVYFAQAVVDGVLKGLGDTRRPMRHAIVCNVLVVVLDPLFIYGLGMGVQGAALATVIARALTLAVALRSVTRLRDTTERPPDAAERPPAGDPADGDQADGDQADGDQAAGAPSGGRPPASGFTEGDPAEGGRITGGLGRVAGEVVRTGLPMSGDFLARALVGMALVEVVAGFGTAAVAGYGIGQKIMLAGVMVFYALRQAAMIRTARSEAVRSPLALGLGAGVVVAVVLNVPAAPVAGLFTGDPAVAVEFLRWMALYLVPFGGLIAVGGVLQASGRGSRLLAATLAGFAVQLPLAYGLSAWLGITGVWLSMAAGAAISLTGALVVRRADDRRPAGPAGLSPSGASGRRAGGPGRVPGPAPRSTRTAADPPSGP